MRRLHQIKVIASAWCGPMALAAALCTSALNSVALGVPPADADGFQVLFNGKDLSGWQTTGNWNIGPDGVISLNPKSTGFRLFPDLKRFLWHSDSFDDFVLKLEFKVAPGDRSGVFVRCASRSKYLEIQIASRASDNEPLTTVNCGGLVYHAAPLENAANPAGQWNEMTITCDGPKVLVELNEILVIDHDLSKSTKTQGIDGGRLAFQNQGNAVHFRNVRIKKLN